MSSAHSRHIAKGWTVVLEEHGLRLVAEAGTHHQEAHQGSSYSNWNTGQGGICEQRDAQTSEVGHEIRAWPETRLMESESGSPGSVLVPGHVSWGLGTP